MSHSFYISAIPNLRYADTIDGLGYPDLKFTDGVEAPADGAWPAGTQYLYRDGVSARPVEVTFENGRLQVRLFQASSLDDYRLGVDLAAAVAERHGVDVEPEDGEPMSAEAFRTAYGDAWIREHCGTMLAMLAQTYLGGAQGLRVAGTQRELEIGPRFMTPLLKDPDTFGQRFFERFRRLQYIDREDVYTAARIRLGSPDGSREVMLSTMGEGVPYVFAGKIEAVALQGPDGDSVEITLDALAEILGDDAHWLSENLLLTPPYTGAAWAALVERARERQVPDLFALGRAAEASAAQADVDPETLRGQLSPAEWQRLLRAPFVVAFVVSAADGSVERKELEGFAKVLAALTGSEDAVLATLAREGAQRFAEFLQEVLGGSLDLAEELVGARMLVDAHCGPRQALQFKASLVALAKRVAEASGGGFLGFGKKISKEEELAIAAIARALELA